jgi:redox-sensitive bicupin YhaK (pirin superfamily)
MDLARAESPEDFGAQSPLKTPTDTLYADVHLAPGAQVAIAASYEERALYTIAGDIEIAGQVLGPGQLLVLRLGDPIVEQATAQAQFMLFGSAPMEGQRYIWWNFVSSRPERIEQGQRGVGERSLRHRVRQEEFIPMPDTKDKPGRATGGVLYP